MSKKCKCKCSSRKDRVSDYWTEERKKEQKKIMDEERKKIEEMKKKNPKEFEKFGKEFKKEMGVK